MGARWFIAGHLTFLSSFITKEAVNNHLAVDKITSASIIAWHSEADNFLHYHRSANLRMGGVKKASCVQRNPKFNLSASPTSVPHSRSRGSDLFCSVSVRGRRQASTLVNVNVEDFDEFTGMFCQAKTFTAFDSDAESRSDLWPAGKVKRKHDDSDSELLHD